MNVKNIIKQIKENPEYIVAETSNNSMTISFKENGRIISIRNTHGSYFSIKEDVVGEKSPEFLVEIADFKAKHPAYHVFNNDKVLQVMSFDEKVQPNTLWLLTHGYDYYEKDADMISIKNNVITRAKIVKIKNKEDIQEHIIKLLNKPHMTF